MKDQDQRYRESAMFSFIGLAGMFIVLLILIITEKC